MSATRTISFTLNGEPVAAEIKPHHNLVELLQREFNLMGARESCGQGLCGCCTVLVDGTAVSGCLYLAAFVDGAEVTTVEHLANGDKLSPGAGGLHRGRRLPVRLLHAGLRADDARSCSTSIRIRTTIRSGTISPAISAAAPPIRRSSRRSRSPRASARTA